MLWKVLVALCLLSLSALASEDEDIDYIRKRKLMSLDKENSTEEEVITENYQVENITESQSQRKTDQAAMDGIEEADKKDKNTPLVFTDQSIRSGLNTSHVMWVMQNTWLHFFSRNEEVKTIRATEQLPELGSSKDLVILVHGASKSQDHMNEFFNTLSLALLKETNYNIIGVDWTENVAPPERQDYVAINIHYAKLLGVMLSFLFETNFPKFITNALNTYYIGEGVGTIPPITFVEKFNKPFRYVYGLNPKKDMVEARYRLAQEHGEVVAILSTNNYPYSYAHKNVYPVPFNGPLSSVHKILARAILNKKTATFCPNANYFTRGYCNTLPTVPIWFTHAHSTDKLFPTGKYYFIDVPEKKRCDTKPF